MKMLLPMVGMTTIAYVIFVLALMVFESIMYFWGLILVVYFAIKIILPPAILIIMIARVFRWTNKSLHKMVVGLLYGVVGSGLCCLLCMKNLANKK